MDAGRSIAFERGLGQFPGEQLKFNPAKPAGGRCFIPGTGSAVKVPNANLATRTEGELLFTVPVLAAGTYHLEVRLSDTGSAVATLFVPSLSPCAARGGGRGEGLARREKERIRGRPGSRLSRRSGQKEPNPPETVSPATPLEKIANLLGEDNQPFRGR